MAPDFRNSRFRSVAYGRFGSGSRRLARRGILPAEAGLQSRHPADSFRELFRLPRSGQKPAQGEVASRCAGGGTRKRRDCSRQTGQKRTRQTHLHCGPGRRDAAAGVAQDADIGAKELVKALDRRRRGLRAALGLHQTGAASRAGNEKSEVGTEPNRRVRSPHPGREGHPAFAGSGQTHAAAPAQPRPHRPAADAGRGRCFSQGFKP